jgi:hypothetical protein
MYVYCLSFGRSVNNNPKVGSTVETLKGNDIKYRQFYLHILRSLTSPLL